MNKFLMVLFFFFGASQFSNAQEIIMAQENWKTNDTTAKFEAYSGKQSLFMQTGTALVKNSKFEDGVIEADVAATSLSGFAGIVFRSQSFNELEVVYLRLFKSGLSDAIQYTPRYRGIDCWQLYTKGYTAKAIFNQVWTHLKIEVAGRTARIYLNGATEPNLIVNDLKRDEGKGEVGLWASGGGVYFANVSYQTRTRSGELIKSKNEFQKGMITKWDVSQAFSATSVNLESYPTKEQLTAIQWESLDAEMPGFLNLSRYRDKERIDNITFNHSEEIVYTKKKIVSTKAQTKKLLFGYSDRVAIFLNGKIIFYGNSAFRSRDQQFLGGIGLNDSLYIDLNKGENELLFAVADKTGGWAVQAQFADTEDIKLD